MVLEVKKLIDDGSMCSTCVFVDTNIHHKYACMYLNFFASKITNFET